MNLSVVFSWLHAGIMKRIRDSVFRFKHNFLFYSDNSYFMYH